MVMHRECEYIPIRIQTIYLRHFTPQAIELQCQRPGNPMFDHPEVQSAGREEGDETASTLSLKPTFHLVNVTTTAIPQATMNSLAVELVDAIIGHVDENDDISRYDLVSCSLVCRLWLPSSQRRLFHYVKFRQQWVPGELYPQIQQLDQVLLDSPSCQCYPSSGAT
jgi:hypothetical protein